MTEDKFTIEGIDRLSKQLKSLPDKMKRSTLLKILRSGSRPLIDAAKHELAQIMEKGFSEGRFPTGNLYNSIGHITGRSIEHPNIQVGARVKRGFKGFHAHWIQYGTMNRRNRKGFRGKVPANPFMDRALATVRSQVAASLAKSVAKEVERIAKQTIVPKY